MKIGVVFIDGFVGFKYGIYRPEHHAMDMCNGQMYAARDEYVEWLCN